MYSDRKQKEKSEKKITCKGDTTILVRKNIQSRIKRYVNFNPRIHKFAIDQAQKSIVRQARKCFDYRGLIGKGACEQAI